MSYAIVNQVRAVMHMTDVRGCFGFDIIYVSSTSMQVLRYLKRAKTINAENNDENLLTDDDFKALEDIANSRVLVTV